MTSPEKPPPHSSQPALSLDLDEVDAALRHMEEVPTSGDGDDAATGPGPATQASQVHPSAGAPPAAPAEGDNAERPTVSPPFDADAYARATNVSSGHVEEVPGLAATASYPPMRPPQATLTDEAELEEARRQSLLSSPPNRVLSHPPEPLPTRGAAAAADSPDSIEPAPETRVSSPSASLLFLANSRLPSMTPPPVPSVGHGWGDQGEATTSNAHYVLTDPHVQASRATAPPAAAGGGEAPSLPPATGSATLPPPGVRRYPTLRPEEGVLAPPSSRAPGERRATRTWTSETTGLTPGGSVPPSSGPPGSRAERAEKDTPFPSSLDARSIATARAETSAVAAGGQPTAGAEHPPVPPGAEVPVSSATPATLGSRDVDDGGARPGAPAAHVAGAAATAPKKGGAVDPRQEMQDRVSLGDYTGALGIAETLLEESPDDTDAKQCAESCRAVLRQMYTARIGPLTRVPVVMVARDQLRWLSIDHRAGFVLSHVDGISSLEMILDVSGMPTLDTLRILCELSQQRIISFR